MSEPRSFAMFAVLALLVAAAAGIGLAALLWSGGSNTAAQAQGSASASGRPTSSPSASKAHHETTMIRLHTDLNRAAPGQRIDLIGRAKSGGVALRVQERDGGRWSDFPATGLTRSDGTFESYVLFGQSGPHVLRMTAPGTGQVSNPVRVVVG